jgi:hypothetical protein
MAVTVFRKQLPPNRPTIFEVQREQAIMFFARIEINNTSIRIPMQENTLLLFAEHIT